MIIDKFNEFLAKELANKTFTEQINILNTLSQTTSDMCKKIQERITKCPSCKEFSLNTEFLIDEHMEIEKDVFIDFSSDPNDDEEFWGDVEVMVTTKQCPICKNKKVINKKATKILRKYLRNEF